MEIEEQFLKEVASVLETKPKKRTHSRPGSITPLGTVCYTVGGAFYVPMQRGQYALNIGEDMHLRKGVYRLEKGGFFDTYDDYQIDRHWGFGDIYDDTFQARFIGDIIMPKVLDSYTIYSSNVVNRIVQRCINS